MSQSLPTLFRRASDYHRQITFTPTGVVAVETADDPNLTQAIRAHAQDTAPLSSALHIPGGLDRQIDPDAARAADHNYVTNFRRRTLDIIDEPAHSIDTVVDFGIIHHVPDWQHALAEIARVLRPGGLLLFEEVPRHVLDTWAFRTLTVHPRENLFEADELAAELGRHGLHGTGRIETRLGGMVFVGVARKT